MIPTRKPCKHVRRNHTRISSYTGISQYYSVLRCSIIEYAEGSNSQNIIYLIINSTTAIRERTKLNYVRDKLREG